MKLKSSKKHKIFFLCECTAVCAALFVYLYAVSVFASVLKTAKNAKNVGLSMMCYALGKERRTCLGESQLRGRMGKLLY